MAEATEALEGLYLDGVEKVHPKVHNPQGFPLPRAGHLILSGNIHKEVRCVGTEPLLRCFQTLTSCLGRVKTQRPSKSASHSFIYLQTTLSSCSTRPFLRMASYQAAGQMSSRFLGGLASSSTTPKTVKQYPYRHMQRHKPPHFTVTFVCQCARVLRCMHPPISLSAHSLTRALFSCRPWRF
jgi:hypothetical protein